MTHVRSALVVMLGALVVAPAVAFGQGQRAYRGLFGGGVGTTDQSLTLNVTFGTGRDTNFLSAVLTEDPTLPSLPPEQVTNTFSTASGVLSYSLTRKKLNISASGQASTLYYKGFDQPFIPTYSAGVNSGYDFGKAGRVSGSYGLLYSPFYNLNALGAFGSPGANLPVLPDQTTGTFIEPTVTNTVSAGYGLNLTKRWSFGANYGYATQFSDSHLRDLRSHTGGVTTSYQITKHLGAHFGLARSFYTSDFNGVEISNTGNQINAGLDYARSLSLTRKMTFSFSTGVSGFSDGNSTNYTAVGTAILTRQIGRSWSSYVAYNRSAGFNALFARPVISDNVTAGLNGLIARRVQFGSIIGLSRGNVGFSGPANDLNSKYATATLNYALLRTLSTGVSYSSYWQKVGAGVLLPAGVLRDGNRQSVTVFVSWWAPLFMKTRTPDATR
jgi:hypothetical protein